MIASIARMKSSLVFAGLALTLVTSASMPMLGAQDVAAKNHKQRGKHSQVQREHKNTKHQRDQDIKGKGGKHCVAELVAGSNEVQHESCYRTFEQAQIAAHSGGSGGEDAQGRNYRESIIAILYDNYDFDTARGTYTLKSSEPNGCTLDQTFEFNSLNSFDNRASSVKVFSGCKATFFADSFLSGSSKTGSIVNGYDIPNMESMNDRASSVRLSKG